MSAPADKDGKHTVRQHLEAAARRGIAAAIKELEGPEIPDALEYVWGWYCQLAATRRFNGMSGHPEPLTYETIDAWSRLTGHTPTPEEVDALLLLDAVSRNPDPVED